MSRWLPWLLGACTGGPAGGEPPVPPDTGDDPDPCGGGYDELVIPSDGTDDRRFVAGGIVAGDFDADGDLDLVAPGPFTARYLRNDGGAWVDDPTALPELDYVDGAGGAAADFDRDGDLDLVITRWGPPDHLLVNDGAGRFVASDALPAVDRHSQSATWGDFDLDGDLDLAIAGHGQIGVENNRLSIEGPGDPQGLYFGDGDGGFTDEAARFEPRMHDGYTFVLGLSELDGDGRPDFVVANDYPWYMPGMGASQSPYEGRWTAIPSDVGLVVHGPGMGLGIGDINDDGLDDFVEPVWNAIVYLRSSAAGYWVEASMAAGLRAPPHDDGSWVGWGAEVADMDNDADLDVVVAWGRLDTIAPRGENGANLDNAEHQRLSLYLQQGGGAFADAAETAGMGRTGVYRGFVVADLDDDGGLDVVSRDLDGAIVIHRRRCVDADWLRVVPTPLDRAVGAVVTVRARDRTLTRTVRAGGTSLCSGGPPDAHFGLGGVGPIDEVEVRWTDGTTTRTGPVDPGQVLVIDAETP